MIPKVYKNAFLNRILVCFFENRKSLAVIFCGRVAVEFVVDNSISYCIESVVFGEWRYKAGTRRSERIQKNRCFILLS